MVIHLVVGRRGHSHVVEESNLSLLVPNNGERHLATRHLIDVLDPALVRLDGVGGQANQLDATLLKLGLELGKGTQLGGAHGRVVLGVGEEHNPLVADELVEVDGALGRLGLEVGGDVAQTEGGVGGHCVWFT